MMLIIAVLALPMAFAAPAAGNVTEQGSQSSYAGISSESVTTEGGNVTEVNVTGYASTARWAGFYGSIDGGIRLGDSGNNIFYEWTVSNFDGSVVYAANTTVSDWSDAAISAAGVGDMPSYLTTGASDNYTNTFDTTEGFASASITEGSTPYITTLETGTGTFKTYSLKNTAGTLIWAGLADQNELGFDGTTVDYQLLVPADSSGVTYNFYLELP